MGYDVAREVAESFASFMRRQPAGRPAEGELGASLMSFFRVWAVDGNAVDVCGGDYTLYLRVWAFVVGMFEHRRDEFGAVADSINRFMNADEPDMETGFLLPEEWRVLVFRRTCGLSLGGE